MRSVRTYGPLDTEGTAGWAVYMSVRPAHTCSGRIGASIASIVAVGFEVRITSVPSAGASTDTNVLTRVRLVTSAGADLSAR